MTTTTKPAVPPPLAEDAGTAERPAGPCRLCQRGILRGQRFARLVPDGHLAHTSCIGLAAGTPARAA